MNNFLERSADALAIGLCFRLQSALQTVFYRKYDDGPNFIGRGETALFILA